MIIKQAFPQLGGNGVYFINFVKIPSEGIFSISSPRRTARRRAGIGA